MNWNKAVSKIHRREFSWEKVAPGWSTREEVAAQLGCAPENVRSKLAVGLRLGRFEAKTFKIWDVSQERFIFREGYRILADGSAKPSSKSAAGSIQPGARVMSRTGAFGTVRSMVKDKMCVEWDTGRNTTPTTAAISKGDLRVCP
jgi:hypothetical protein